MAPNIGGTFDIMFPPLKLLGDLFPCPLPPPPPPLIAAPDFEAGPFFKFVVERGSFPRYMPS